MSKTVLKRLGLILVLALIVGMLPNVAYAADNTSFAISSEGAKVDETTSAVATVEFKATEAVILQGLVANFSAACENSGIEIESITKSGKLEGAMCRIDPDTGIPYVNYISAAGAQFDAGETILTLTYSVPAGTAVGNYAVKADVEFLAIHGATSAEDKEYQNLVFDGVIPVTAPEKYTISMMVDVNGSQTQVIDPLTYVVGKGVRLTAPETYKKMAFNHWEVYKTPKGETEQTLVYEYFTNNIAFMPDEEGAYVAIAFYSAASTEPPYSLRISSIERTVSGNKNVFIPTVEFSVPDSWTIADVQIKYTLNRLYSMQGPTSAKWTTSSILNCEAMENAMFEWWSEDEERDLDDFRLPVNSGMYFVRYSVTVNFYVSACMICYDANGTKYEIYANMNNKYLNTTDNASNIKKCYETCSYSAS